MTNETITTDTQNTFYQTVNELEEAMRTQNLYSEYITLDETWKKRFTDYMTGKKTMPLTYDPFSNVCFTQTDIQIGCQICSVPFWVNPSLWNGFCHRKIQPSPLIPC